MGVLWSILGYRRTELRDDDPDPITSLTSKDRHIIRSSWARVMKKPIESGTALLTLMGDFRHNCSAIMYALTSVVDAVDKPDLLVAILTKVGRDHVPRGVSEEGHLVRRRLQLLLLNIHELSTLMLRYVRYDYDIKATTYEDYRVTEEGGLNHNIEYMM
nr:unnamed protein product [Callosobruchus analis]